MDTFKLILSYIFPEAAQINLAYANGTKVVELVHNRNSVAFIIEKL